MTYISIVIFISLVIFIHEFGHFIVARLFGVKVEIFSIGFGKRLFSFKKGETEYRIALIPLGGYVKMLGEGESEEPLSKEDLPKAFSSKKWWQKALVVFAGPFFNFVFAVFLYFIISFYNHTSTAPIVEFVSNNSPAYTFGIKAGDVIEKINGQKIYVWDDISENISEPKNGKCEEVSLTVKRFPTNELKTIKLLPKLTTYKDMFGDKQSRCLLGISAMPVNTLVAFFKPVEKFQNGDEIVAINGKKVERFYELKQKLNSNLKISTITVLRKNKRIKIEVTEAILNDLKKNVLPGGMLISKVKKSGFVSRLGIKSGDFLYKVQNEQVLTPFDFMDILKKSKNGTKISLQLLRNGEIIDKSFKLDIEKEKNKFTGMKEQHIKWDADFLFNYSIEPKKAKRGNLLKYTFAFTFGETKKITTVTFKGLYSLLTGKISSKTIGGPIMVFDISRRAAKRGLKTLMYVIAMISINLGIINLFPIPALDGFHIFMYSFEGLTKKEIKPKVKEVLTIIGFSLLIMLMIYAFFNDITHYIPLMFGNK